LPDSARLDFAKAEQICHLPSRIPSQVPCNAIVITRQPAVGGHIKDDESARSQMTRGSLDERDIVGNMLDDVQQKHGVVLLRQGLLEHIVNQESASPRSGHLQSLLIQIASVHCEIEVAFQQFSGDAMAA